MIGNLIRRVFKKKPNAALDPAKLKPHVFARDAHHIRPDHISNCAMRVTRALQEGGYKAFIVGGAVRDLLLGRSPKDFDVATDATPNDIRRLIRRSRIIGRRFQIVHALCGDDVVEVSTFRAYQPTENQQTHSKDEHGRVLRDNVFGSQAEDALRRDFTVNALFYDPVKEEVWDFGNGVRDLQQKTVRIIGEPEARYREDPVRMLRAVRFAAKLGFEIDKATREPITRLAPLLANVPPSRLFDEMLKLLLSGHAHACVHRLRKEGLHHGMFPLLDVIFEQPLGERFINLALTNTDKRVQEDKPVSAAFVLAALLWHEVLAAWQKAEQGGMKSVPALHQAMHQVLEVQEQRLAIPHRYDAIMRELWLMQPRFLKRSGGTAFRMVQDPRFRAAMDFLLLRCEAGEAPAELGQWWQTFQAGGEEERRAMLLPSTTERKKRRRRGGRKGRGKTAAQDGGQTAPDSGGETSEA